MSSSITKTSSKSSNKTVLITGINGYIASVLGLEILSKGYNLRGTSRSKDRAAALLDHAYKDYASRVEIFEVEDITEPGAFDEAVRGVCSIHHTASPMDFSVQDWNAWVQPADESCTEILKSALKHAGPQLESFVFLSSAVVGLDPRRRDLNPRTGVEWHDCVEEARKKFGPQAAANVLYQASKSLAEKAVWDFRYEHKPSFSVCSINPNIVIGPPVQPPATASALGVTLRPIWEILSGSGTSALPGFGTHGFVDVRDVAWIHIWCMEHPTHNSDKRIRASAGLERPQGVVDTLRQAYPEREDVILQREPGKGYLPDTVQIRGRAVVNGVQASQVTGIKYIPYKQSILETAKVLERYLDG